MSGYACSMSGGSGCPEVDGGEHYFVDLGDGVRCLDCGAPPSAEKDE